MRVIGIAGYARCGKDTFVGIAKNILRRNGYTPIRVAFADRLKEEVTSMLESNGFKTTVYTEDSEAKKLIRPLLVWWGCQRRYESEGGLHWVNTANDKIKLHMGACPPPSLDSEKLVFLVSDVRFANEAKWVHDSWDGVVIHLKRWVTEWHKCGQDGSDEVACKVYDAAPNEEEAKNDPLVQELSDHRIEWESAKKMTAEEAITSPELQQVVLEALNATKYFKHPTIGTLS